MSDLMNLGKKIVELRTRKGYSQEKMAELLDMSSEGYARIEQDKSPNISLKRLMQIASVLESNIFELLALGDKGVYYINHQKNKLNGYIINHSLPEDFRTLQHQNELLSQENEFLKRENENLQKLVKALEKK